MHHKNTTLDLYAAANQQIKEYTYWQNRFPPSFEKTGFPYDFFPLSPEPHQPGLLKIEYESVSFPLPLALSTRLMEIAGHSDPRLHMLLTTGLITTLYKYALDENHITVGMPIYHQENTQPFINTLLPLICHVNNNNSFKNLLLQVRQTITDAVANQNYPMTILAEQLDLKTETNRFPFFDIAILLTSIHDRSLLNDIQLDMIFSFEWVKKEGDSENAGDNLLLQANIEYDNCHFGKNSICQFGNHLTHILQEATCHLDLPIQELALLTTGEKLKLVEELNQGGYNYSPLAELNPQRLIHELFADQVEKTRDRVAIAFNNEYLTYGELNLRANYLSSWLKSRGVQKDTLVALVMDPSVEMMTSIWGILKAGGAYLPLDAGLPAERLSTILDDSHVSLVLTRNRLHPRHSLTTLQGISHQELTPHVTPRRSHITDFNSIPFPDRSLVNYEKYNQYIGHNLIQNCISIQATRGCPYNCAYCHKIWPKKHVVRSAEHIFAELMFNYQIGIRRFSFVDDIFNFDRENSRRFFQLVAKAKLNVQLFFLMRGDILTHDYIDLMVEAGLVRLGLALETASPRLQKLIRKNLDINKLHENMSYLSQSYPQVILELYTMHGFPTETESEAMMNMDFIKSIHWIHFPYIFILVIYPDTDMEKLALDNGISAKAIDRSLNRAFHQLPETLPFDRSFTVSYQAELLNDYFLSKERLLQVLPLQMQTLTEAEMVQKYNSYLPVDIKSFNQLLEFTGINRHELSRQHCLDEKEVFVPELNKKNKKAFSHFFSFPSSDIKTRSTTADNQPFRLLLLDLSQNFSQTNAQLDDLVEPPLGLMYLLTYLNQQYGDKIIGKIAKAMIDFDNFPTLKALLLEFKPQLIGIRTLSIYKDFFHETVAKIRLWGVKAPIITGGPYATSSYKSILQDKNIDLVVLGEGELTLKEIVEKMMANPNQWLNESTLETIESVAFIREKEKIQHRFAREVLCLDQLDHHELLHLAGQITKNEPDHPELDNNIHNLAYAIFTSGSTGQPKGVLLQHQGLNHLITGLRDRVYARYGLNPAPYFNISLVAPYVFDASVKQIFAALLQGHTLYIVPEMTRGDGPGLLDFFQRHAIHISDGTPTLLRLLTESLKGHREKEKHSPSFSLKHLLIGGETLTKNMVKEFFQYWPGLTPLITNVYGPTEATVDSASLTISRENIDQYDTLPIGQPLPFDRLFILNAGNELLPPGVAGELGIAGTKIARGYLNQPGLTAEKFIPTPINWFKPVQNPIQGNQRENILYKTGDKARWLADGMLEYLGRLDHQVKVRGFRIELEEIEKRLLTVKGIKEAAVIVDTDKNGLNHLHAYIVIPGDEKPRDISHIQSDLAHALPEYMIPGQWFRLQQLPRSRNNKIDRQKLKATAKENLERVISENVAPRNPVEKELVEILEHVLGRHPVGIFDNFFMIGGDSIKTLQIVSGMNKAGYKVEMRDIFEKPTVAQLAPLVKPAEPVSKDTVITGAVKLTPVQIVFFQAYTIERHHFNQAILFLSKQRLVYRALAQAVIHLQEHHDALRMTYHCDNNNTWQQINQGLDYPHEVTEYDLTHETHETGVAKMRETCETIQRSINLETGPLMKIALFHLDDGDRLLLVLHHLVVDGVSWRLVFADLDTLYHHFLELPLTLEKNNRAILPAKTTSLQSWTEKLYTYAGTTDFLKEKTYWSRIEMTDIAPIPHDFNETITYMKDLENLSFILDETETTALLTSINQLYHTETNDILLTALAAAFYQVFGLPHILVALEGHGREPIIPDVDLSRTLGWLTSIYPVIFTIPGPMVTENLIPIVKNTLRQVPNRGVGYGILKYLTPDHLKTDIHFQLTPQIGFNYLGQFASDVASTSFTAAPEPPGTTHSPLGIRQYDFSFNSFIGGPQLVMTLAYSRQQYAGKTAQTLLNHFENQLKGIIHHERKNK